MDKRNEVSQKLLTHELIVPSAPIQVNEKQNLVELFRAKAEAVLNCYLNKVTVISENILSPQCVTIKATGDTAIQQRLHNNRTYTCFFPSEKL